MKFAKILPATYCAVALLAWLDFARLPPDGLANVGLMLVVWPVALFDLALRPADAPGSFVLMPTGLGYYGNHAAFYFPSVICIATALWLLGSYADRWRARAARQRKG